VLAVGTAVGFAELSVLVAAGVLAGVLTEVVLLELLVLLLIVVVLPLVLAEEEPPPPPPPPQAARLVRSAATSAHAMVRIVLIGFIAGRPD
jgi:hypothetical protein